MIDGEAFMASELKSGCRACCIGYGESHRRCPVAERQAGYAATGKCGGLSPPPCEVEMVGVGGGFGSNGFMNAVGI